MPPSLPKGASVRSQGPGYAASGRSFYLWDEEKVRVSAFAAELAHVERYYRLNAGVCAWCGDRLEGAKAASRERALPESHGICGRCRDERV